MNPNGQKKLTVKPREAGLSLIELMIAIALGIVLTLGILRVMDGTRATFILQDGLSRVQESGRAATEIVAIETRLAGAAQCINLRSTLDFPVAGQRIHLLDLVPDGDAVAFGDLTDNEVTVPPNDWRQAGIRSRAAPPPFTVHEYTGTAPGDTFVAGAEDPAPDGDAANWSPAIDADLADLAIPGSDILVLRYADPEFFPVRGFQLSADSDTALPLPPATPVTQIEIQARDPLTEPVPNPPRDLYVVSNCVLGSIFRAEPGAALAADVTRPAGRRMTILEPGGLDEGELYGSGATVSPLRVVVFYVGVSAGGGPALFRRQLQLVDEDTLGWVTEELVEGVESFQILVGIDVPAAGGTPDGQTVAYVTAEDLADGTVSTDGRPTLDDDGEQDLEAMDWYIAPSVRLAMLVRSPGRARQDIDAATYDVGGVIYDPVDDDRLRQVFAQTIGLRNRFGNVRQPSP